MLTEFCPMLAVYSLTHFLVDFSCAFLTFSRFLTPRHWVLCLVLYNFFAFAMQAPLGILGDRFNRNAILAAAGCVIVGLSAFCGSCAILGCILAGLGNALFHLGGGIDILNQNTEKAGKLGVFISPGAYGIYLGTKLGKTQALSSGWVIAALLIAALMILFCARHHKLLQSSGNAPVSLPKPKETRIVPALLCFFIVVLLRSFAGNTMSFFWKSNPLWSFLFISAVVLGKTCGGFLADRFGADKVSKLSLGAAAILFLLADSPIPGILAVFLFNMTMPITLRAAARLLPGCKGFSFGLLTLALFMGLVPLILHPGLTGLPNAGFSLIAAFSALLLEFGLKKGKIQ